MQTATYYRKPFPVQGVQVTPENMNEVAAWCKGEVLTTNPSRAGGSPKAYIKVPVSHPKNVKQTMAFPNDWVLAAGYGSFKVYTNKAFTDTFDSSSIEIHEDHEYGAVIGAQA